MTIEIALLISGVSLAFALYSGITNLKRNQRSDDRQDATEITTVIVKLEIINTTLTELKSEMASIRIDNEKFRERLVKVEESTKQAHRRIDDISKRKVVDLDE
ncbi:MAG: hypothetical protein ACK5LY_04980 [Lachnospirales bacterium]